MITKLLWKNVNFGKSLGNCIGSYFTNNCSNFDSLLEFLLFFYVNSTKKSTGTTFSNASRNRFCNDSENVFKYIAIAFFGNSQLIALGIALSMLF